MIIVYLFIYYYTLLLYKQNIFYLDNIINLTMIQISQYFKQQTYYLLTNNHISLSIINNILIIKSNPSNINIIKLLNKNYISYKIIK